MFRNDIRHLKALLLCIWVSHASAFTLPTHSEHNVFKAEKFPAKFRHFSNSGMTRPAYDRPSSLVTDLQVENVRKNVTLTFPSFEELISLPKGECVVSETISVASQSGKTYDFRVKLYPRGGHRSSKSVLGAGQQSGFGMSYRILSAFDTGYGDKVSAYLQYMPRDGEETSCVDASYALRLVGRQTNGPRFSVEWRSGMRFVPLEESKLAEGRANDFGAGLMQTSMLASFLGVSIDSNDPKAVVLAEENSRSPINMEVEILLHERTPVPSMVPTGILVNGFSDIRDEIDDGCASEDLRVGRIVVPVLKNIADRPRMFQQGVYPGVEYRILRIIDPVGESDVFYGQNGYDYELKPIYPLVQQLERQWPVRINEKEIPKLLTVQQYNAISAIGSLFTAFAGLFTAFLVSQAISFYVIPSRSMEPTLAVGDVLIVEKVSPRLFPKSPGNGDVVLFHPPERLRRIVEESGGQISNRDLFVKRIAATSRSTVTVRPDGTASLDGTPTSENRNMCGEEPLKLIEKYITPSETQVQSDEVFVMGDCSSVSIDSRVWGALPRESIVGRPLFRVWPVERIGLLPPLETDWK